MLGSDLGGTARHLALTLAVLADDTGMVAGRAPALSRLGRATAVRRSWLKGALQQLQHARMIARPAAAPWPDTPRPITLTLPTTTEPT